jgi:hypothetical protein
MSSGPTPQQRWIEEIAAKYFSVWIWSIVLGITTSTSFSLVNYFPRARGPLLVLLLAPLMIASAFSVLISWFAVVRFFDQYILPTFFGGGKVDPLAKRFLFQAVVSSLMALAFRLMLSIADLALSSNF